MTMVRYGREVETEIWNAADLYKKAILFDEKDIGKLTICSNETLRHYLARSVQLNARISDNKIKITHPFHPLFGEEFEIIDDSDPGGFDRIYFLKKDGAKGSVPRSWCSLRPPDPYLDMDMEHPEFRVEDLLELSIIIREVKLSIRR